MRDVLNEPGKGLFLNYDPAIHGGNQEQEQGDRQHVEIPPPRFYVIHYCRLPDHDWSSYETLEEAQISLRIRRLKTTNKCLSTCHVAIER